MHLAMVHNRSQRLSFAGSSTAVFKRTTRLHKDGAMFHRYFVDRDSACEKADIQRFAKTGVELHNQTIGELTLAEIAHLPVHESRDPAVLNNFSQQIVGDLVITDVEFHGVKVARARNIAGLWD